MFKKIEKYILILVLIIAAALRLWRLGEYPALNADEAAIGYNAYSLIETGLDEHGNPWPIHFQSFNDYKPGLVFYLVAPFVKIFGLNEWSVRLPGALLGVATVYLVYLLVKELVKDKKLGILAAALLAISPWHIHFSRGIWEVNVSTFFITLGIYLFYKGFGNFKYFTLSTLSFALSLYTYHSARVIVPLLGIGLLVLYRKNIVKNAKYFVVACITGAVFLTPLMIDLTKGSVFARAAGIGLFADPGIVERINEQRSEHLYLQGIRPRIIHNKVINFSLVFLKNWAEHFYGEFLFLSGDEIQRNKVPETGQMYLFDLVFLIAGLIAIARKYNSLSSRKTNVRQGWGLVLWWLLIAPTAASLTFQSPHALRAQNMVIPLIIINALGLTAILDWLKRQKRYLLAIGRLLLVIVIAWQFARYQLMYWKHLAKEYPFSSQYGVKELVGYIKLKGDRFEKIIVTDRYDQPYILFLFYLKYPPEEFQKNHSLSDPDVYGFSTVRAFDKYEFRSVDFDYDRVNYPGSLLIGTDKEIPDETNIVKKIYGTNGYLYFKVVAN